MKIKRFMAMAIACVMAAGLVACGGSDSTASTTGSTTGSSAAGSTADTTALSGGVATGGSTSVEAVIGALSEAFMEENSGVDVTYDPTGSGAGVTGARRFRVP